MGGPAVDKRQRNQGIKQSHPCVFGAVLQTLLVTVLTSALLASPAANERPLELELGVPFGCGLSFTVSQAHNTGSHTFNDVWAWDFRMPEGTPVVAAMDGVVRMARGDSTVGGCDQRFAPFANYVVVTHAGGIETQYLHFREVLVQAGEHVKAGDLLGYSGQTGWACGAHLHFKLAHQKSRGWNNPSVPALIRGYGDPAVDTEIAAPACPVQKNRVQIAGNQGPPPAPQARETVRPASDSESLPSRGRDPQIPDSQTGNTLPAASRGPTLSPPAQAAAGPI